MPIYNKLVRDNIPQILHKQNLNFRHKILQEKEFQKYLRLKLDEEILELDQAINSEDKLEELADILEILFTMTSSLKYKKSDLMKTRDKKLTKKGGFQKKYFLIDVED